MLNSPLANFSAKPLIYSALRSDRPAVRSVAISSAATCDGLGNTFEIGDSVGSVLKSDTNLALIDFAAAPDTWFISQPAGL